MSRDVIVGESNGSLAAGLRICRQGGTGIKKNYPGSNFLLRPPPSRISNLFHAFEVWTNQAWWGDFHQNKKTEFHHLATQYVSYERPLCNESNFHWDFSASSLQKARHLLAFDDWVRCQKSINLLQVHLSSLQKYRWHCQLARSDQRKSMDRQFFKSYFLPTRRPFVQQRRKRVHKKNITGLTGNWTRDLLEMPQRNPNKESYY